MRSVVVLPQPDGPSRAKNEPAGISSEIPATATTSSKRLTTSTSRTSAGACSRPAALPRPAEPGSANGYALSELPERGVKTSQCRSTSAAVVAGQTSAML